MNDIKITTPTGLSYAAQAKAKPLPEEKPVSVSAPLVKAEVAVEAKEKIEASVSVERQEDAAAAITERLAKAIEQLNDYMVKQQRSLEFSFDKDASRPVVTVLDSSTKKVVRQIPDEVVLELARNLNTSEAPRLFETSV